MTRSEIFEIMGKYYGNAYFGHYDEEKREGPPISVEYLMVLRNILDEFNSLGYNISNLGKLGQIEDKRFVPIIVNSINTYGLDGPMFELLYALNRLSYHEATPAVLKWHQDPRYQTVPVGPKGHENTDILHWNISDTAYQIRNKKYLPLYLEIIRKDGYGSRLDRIIEIPLLYRNREALDLLLNMQEQYGIWGWFIVKYVPRFKDASLIPELEKLLSSSDIELRKKAKKAIETAVTNPVNMII